MPEGEHEVWSEEATTSTPFRSVRRVQAIQAISIDEERARSRGAVIALFLAASFGMMALLSFPLSRGLPSLGRFLRPPAVIGGLAPPIFRPIDGSFVLSELPTTVVARATPPQAAPGPVTRPARTPTTGQREGRPGADLRRRLRHGTRKALGPSTLRAFGSGHGNGQGRSTFGIGGFDHRKPDAVQHMIDHLKKHAHPPHDTQVHHGKSSGHGKHGEH